MNSILEILQCIRIFCKNIPFNLLRAAILHVNFKVSLKPAKIFQKLKFSVKFGYLSSQSYLTGSFFTSSRSQLTLEKSDEMQSPRRYLFLLFVLYLRPSRIDKTGESKIFLGRIDGI
jgi:hypothetical protein